MKILTVAAAAFVTLTPAARAGEGWNVDFGSFFGVPASSYGAAAGQVGAWNKAGLGVTPLVDLAGAASGASVNVVADNGFGNSGGSPATGAELLLSDNFLSVDGASWSVVLSGLGSGDYAVFLFAPSNHNVPTGTMTVGGLAVPGIPGDPDGALIQGKSWLQVPATVASSTLAISGQGATFSGLAGLQVVPAGEFTSYCTAGVGASGCQAALSASGVPSATATSGFLLIATGVEGARDGLFFFGANGRQAAPWGSSGAFQCVQPPVSRTRLLQGFGTVGSCNNSMVDDLNAWWCSTCPRPAQKPGVGTLVQAQLWYRDPWNSKNSTATNFSDAIEFSVLP
jgi:hypothetical protein